MPLVVKILVSEDGEKIPYAKWCLSWNKAGGRMTLCTGQFYGMGESSCKYKEKHGKITCPECIEEIKMFKSIKL